MATAVAPPVTPKTTTSVDPLYTQALEQAKAALAAQTAPITAEQNASDAAYQQKETDATGASAALSELLKPIGPQVNSEYQTAGQNIELAANGFSHGMQDALQGNTDNLNAMLKSLGQHATLDSHASEAGDVLYGLGGYTPGTAFQKEGAAFGAAADLQAGDALLRGQEDVKSLRAKAIVADQGFQSKIAELAGKLPGNTETNYQKLKSMALASDKFAHQLAQDKFNNAAKLKSLALSVDKYKTSVDEFNARQVLAYKKLTVQESQFAQRQANSDRAYAVTLANLGISQKRLQLSIAGNAFKQAHGGFTAAQVAKFSGKLDTLVAAGAPTKPVNGVMPTPQYLDKIGMWHDITPGTAVPKNATVRNDNTYARFVTAALRAGVPIQLALDRANTIFPETSRTLPPALQNLPAVAAAAAAQNGAYAQTTGKNVPWDAAPPGHVSMAPGADRAGVPTSVTIKSFASALSGALGAPVTIGTGSNHNKMTADGNVSDHWTGHASDITSVGNHSFDGSGPGHIDPELTRAGQEALVLAGANPQWAAQQTGGLFDLNTAAGRVQIIFNSFQGGNHYNHLHVGLK